MRRADERRGSTRRPADLRDPSVRGPHGFDPERPTIVGVLNVTPDSFSDGGRFTAGPGAVDVEGALAAAKELAAAGAHIIDVGGESTRPGAQDVPEALERSRTIPVIAALAEQLGIPISIDTRKASIAEEALQAGARIVNDVSGLLHDPNLAKVAAHADATLIIGHLRGTPATMQDDPRFDDTIAEVGDELEASVERALAAGCDRSRLVVDPGIGFGKRLEDNLSLIANCGELRQRLGLPLLIGASRKGFLGTLTHDPIEARDTATVAASAIALFAGADAIRVHDVASARRASAVAAALRDAARFSLPTAPPAADEDGEAMG